MRHRAEIVQRALSHVGHRETAENDSPLIREWLERCGINEPAAWCAAFASWCLEDVALAGAVKLGRAYPETHTPKPGDLMWFPTNDKGNGHVGIVVEVDEREALCVEGNSANRVRLVRRLRSEVRFSRTRGPDPAWAAAPLVRASFEGTR